MGLVADALEARRAEKRRAEIFKNDPHILEAIKIFGAVIEENGGTPPAMPGWKNVDRKPEDHESNTA